MIRTTLKITLIIFLLLNNAQPSYLSRENSGNALRPTATAVEPQQTVSHGSATTKQSSSGQSEPQLPPYTEKILKALDAAKGNQAQAAEDLVMSYSTFTSRVDRIWEVANQLNTHKAGLVLRRLARVLSGKNAGKRRRIIPKYTDETLSALEEAEGNQVLATDILNTVQQTIASRVVGMRNAADKLNARERKCLLARLNKALSGGKAYMKADPFPGHANKTINTLFMAGGNLQKAAKELGISLKSLKKRIARIKHVAENLEDKKEGDKILEYIDLALRAERIAPYELKESEEKERPSELPRWTYEVIGALEQAEGSRISAARMLDLSPSGLISRVDSIRKAAKKLKKTRRIKLLKRLDRALSGKRAGQRSNILPRYTQKTIYALINAMGNRLLAAEILDISPSAVSARINAIEQAAEELDSYEGQMILKRLERAASGKLSGKTVFLSPSRKKDMAVVTAAIYMHQRFRFYPATVRGIREWMKEDFTNPLSSQLITSGLSKLHKLGIVKISKTGDERRYELIDWVKRLDQHQYDMLVQIIASNQHASEEVMPKLRKIILLYLLKARVEQYENYIAPLSEKGRYILQKAGGVLGLENPSNKAIKEALKTLYKPKRSWFVKCFESPTKKETALLKKVIYEFSWGCTTQCDYCFVNQPAKTWSMPWPWVIELTKYKSARKSGSVASIHADPLREYYDPIFDKTAADLAIVYNYRKFDTTGFEPGSVGERAAREMKDRNLNVRYGICINVVNSWIRNVGQEKYIRYMQYTRDVLGSENITWNDYNTTRKGDGFDPKEVIRRIRGEFDISGPAVTAGRLVHIDSSRYFMLEYAKGQFLVPVTVLLPNGDIAAGPLTIGWREFVCLRRHPSSRPIMMFVDKPAPRPDLTDKSDSLPFAICDFYEIYNTEPNISSYYVDELKNCGYGLKYTRRYRDMKPGQRFCPKTFWIRFLKGYMNKAHQPHLWKFKNKKERDYAEALSKAPLFATKGKSGLNEEFYTRYFKYFKLPDVDVPIGGNLLRMNMEHIFPMIMQQIIKGRDHYRAVLDEHPYSRKAKQAIEDIDKMLMVMREFIYRHWDAGYKLKSHYFFSGEDALPPGQRPCFAPNPYHIVHIVQRLDSSA